MKSEKLISLNGSLCSEDEAKISIFDRGFLFGDSVYEVTMCQNGLPFEIEAPSRSSFSKCHETDFSIGKSRPDFYRDINELLKKFGKEAAYLRIIVTRGVGEISLDPDSAGTNNFILIAQELPEYPKDWYEKGVHLIMQAERLRNQAASLDPNVKSGNYLNSVMAHSEAKKLKAYDAVMLNQEGKVTEASNSNIWLVKEGLSSLHRSDRESSRPHKKRCDGNGEEKTASFEEREVSVDDLYAADECFLTSTTKRLVPVTSIDGVTYGNGKPGPITQKLMRWDKKYCEKEWKRMSELWKVLNFLSLSLTTRQSP